MSAPQGTCKIVETVDRKPANKFAVFAQIIVEDEAGQQFYFEASSFLFDLKPLERDQP